MRDFSRLPTTLGLLALSLSTTACHGLIWGNLAMLAIAVGIFMGTLSLGRK